MSVFISDMSCADFNLKIFYNNCYLLSGTIELDRLKDLKISLENLLKTSEKKVRDVTSEKDDAEVMLSRKEKETNVPRCR